MKDTVRNEFAQLLFNTFIESPDFFEEKYKPIHLLIKEKTPTSLFRFRSCNTNNIDAFRKNQVYHSFPEQFNDPHDALVYINRKEIFDIISTSSNIKKLGNWFDLIKKNETLHELPIEIQKLFEENSFKDIETRHDNPQEIIHNYNEKAKSDADYWIKSTLDDFRKRHRIACFSENIKSTLMWAHYADSHKGFAIEYQFGDLINPCTYCEKPCQNKALYYLFPVLYNFSRYDATKIVLANFFNTFANQFNIDLSYMISKIYPMDMLSSVKANLCKGQEWSYELEWRSFLICPNNKNKNHISISPISIYLGAEIEDINEYFLRKIAEEKNIIIKKMKISHENKNYELDYA